VITYHPATQVAHRRLAVVTGAAGGIGSALAAKLAADGVDVAACDREATAVRDLAERLSSYGLAGQVTGFRLDVSDTADVESVVASIERDLGPVELLANVAGVLTPAPAIEICDADWHTTFAVNSTGVMNVSRAVGRRMADRGSGSIVTVGSNAAAVPRVGMAAYCASKAAARIFTQVLGLELARNGVRANVVSPGSTDSSMLRDLLAGSPPDAVIDGDLATYKTGVPLGRIATPKTIADAVAFLFSDAARHITLHDLRVDGGATLDA